MSATPSTRPATPSSAIDPNEEVPTNDAPIRNTKYYIDDDASIFLVENQLFKVHRHFLARDSDVFHAMFQMPPGETVSVEGRTDDSPITLSGASAEEFQCLLDFYYRGTRSDDTITEEEWTLLLAISTKLSFDELSERCIKELSPGRCQMDPIQRIVLAQRHDIPEWLRAGFEDICYRKDPLEVGEAEKIGLATAMRLANARELLWRDVSIPSPPPSPLPQSSAFSWSGGNLFGAMATQTPSYHPPYSSRRIARVVDQFFEHDQ